MNLGLCYAQLPQQRVLVIALICRTCGADSMLTIRAPSDWPKLWRVMLSRRCHCSDQSKELVRLACRDGLVISARNLYRYALAEFLAHCGELFKVILIDTPPILPWRISS